MTRPKRPIRIAGEPVAALMPAIVALHDAVVLGDDGMARTQDRLPPEVAAPLRRALLRVEAELLKRDAGVWDDLARSRSPEERRTDAFVLLMQRVTLTLRRLQHDRSRGA